MSKILLKNLDVIVQINSDFRTDFLHYFNFYRINSLIPSIKIVSQGKPNFIIELKHSNKIKFNIYKNKLIIKGIPTDKASYSFLIILTKIFEKLQNERKRILFHSSSVIMNNEAFIILGENASGKTFTMLNLIKLGAKFISNNATIIGNKKGIPLILGGTKIISIRNEDYFFFRKLKLYDNDKERQEVIGEALEILLKENAPDIEFSYTTTIRLGMG